MSYQRDLTTLWQRVEALEQAQRQTEALVDDHGETLDRLEMAAAEDPQAQAPDSEQGG